MLKPVPKKDYGVFASGVNDMGLVYAEIELTNAGDAYLVRKKMIPEADRKSVRVNALVDTGAFMLSINETVRAQLDLPFIEKQMSQLADDSLLEVEVVGPVEVRFENRRTTCDAIVMPGEAQVLLGSIPMEDMDVIIEPRQQKLMVNPKHPYIAQKYLK